MSVFGLPFTVDFPVILNGSFAVIEMQLGVPTGLASELTELYQGERNTRISVFNNIHTIFTHGSR